MLRSAGGGLDELLQALVVDVRRRPLGHLISWEVVAKLHVAYVWLRC